MGRSLCLRSLRLRKKIWCNRSVGYSELGRGSDVIAVYDLNVYHSAIRDTNFREVYVGELFSPVHLIILMVVFGMQAIIFVIPFWQIFKKAGLSAPLSILMIIPLVNIIMLYFLAFSPWKVVPAGDSKL